MSKRPTCWRCFWSDMAGLPTGLTIGWWRAWSVARGQGFGLSVAWLYWRRWYWPGYIHPHGWGLPCRHDRQQPVNPAGGELRCEHTPALLSLARRWSTIPCCSCGGPVAEFSRPNAEWNATMRPDGHEHDREYLCASCYMDALARRTEQAEASLVGVAIQVLGCDDEGELIAFDDAKVTAAIDGLVKRSEQAEEARDKALGQLAESDALVVSEHKASGVELIEASRQRHRANAAEARAAVLEAVLVGIKYDIDTAGYGEGFESNLPEVSRKIDAALALEASTAP